jgi:hypothetical protein
MPADAQEPTPPPLRPSVFISYATADRAAARGLRDTLTAAGLEVWLDEDELGGGEAWDAKIRNQIRTCTYFMPVISATTEVRREGYFRREWRFAVERTLDLADDVLFLIPVVIDGTRDAGARVPEKFFSVQWLRCPAGQPTPALRELAGKLARGEAVAHETTVPLAPPAAEDTRKSRRKAAEPPPPFPKFPAFPEPGHRLRFVYDLVIWFGLLLRSLWGHLPRVVRVIAAIVIIFNLIAAVFRERTVIDTSARKAKQSEAAAEVKKAAEAAKDTPNESGDTTVKDAAGVFKSLVTAAAEGLQGGKRLALVTFSGDGPDAEKYADKVFARFTSLMPPGPHVSLSPIPFAAEPTSEDCLERGVGLKSRLVLTGFVHTPVGAPAVFTARLYSVKQRQFIWTETFDTAAMDPAAVAQRLATEVKQRNTPPPPAAPTQAPATTPDPAEPDDGK